MLAVGGQLMCHVDPLWVRMATPLAGGVGCKKQEICGALSGGVLVIGALHGRDQAGVDDSIAQQLATEYRTRFLSELNETRCQPLYDRFHEPDGTGSCSSVAETAARILLELLSVEE